MLKVGLRVVRGPDWKWQMQDGGEGHCGTVIEIGKLGSKESPDKTVVVQWDSGTRTNYRVGFEGAYDLRIVDNAPAGVCHATIVCDGCKKQGIAGIRYKCTRCYDYDLCFQCYMSDQHDINHPFQRFDTANSLGIDLPPRRGSTKLQLQGIFVGAKVVRGANWEWGNQDGGEGKEGIVLDVKGWENESVRSVVNVSWSTSGSINVYRLGHKGKVDLKCVNTTSGGYYYRQHVPVLGQGVDLDELAESTNAQKHLTFNPGDNVKVMMSVDALKQIQEGHGGWNQRMETYIGEMGVVHRVTDRGDIRVKYDDGNRWTFHPGALTKIDRHQVGDLVCLITDQARCRELQKGHGDWVDKTQNGQFKFRALGKVGRITQIYPDGDLRVKVDKDKYTLNPLCVTPIPRTAVEATNEANLSSLLDSQLRLDGGGAGLGAGLGAVPCETLLREAAHGHVDFVREFLLKHPDKANLSSLLDSQLRLDGGGAGLGAGLGAVPCETLLREAAHGHVDFVREFLLKHPDKVDVRSGGNKTCLMVACHQGHMDIVCLLLSHQANIELEDADGDRALHYATFGSQPDIIELLLNRGADINQVNKQLCSALHIAANKQHVSCTRVLLKYSANVNIQDSYGDTPLHDAIGKDNLSEIIELLCSVPSIDFSLYNKRGFNVLHQASIKGNNFATEKILVRSRQLVDEKKEDGFGPLHLACLNGHKATAETLLVKGQAHIDIRNNKQQTPLLLAVSQGHCAVIELLVSAGCDLEAVDEEGDSALHIVLMKRNSISTEIQEEQAPTIHGIWTQVSPCYEGYSVALAIACYLVQEGCQLDRPNLANKTPLDLVADTNFAQIFNRYIIGQRSLAADEAAAAAAVEGETSGGDDECGGGEGGRKKPKPVECVFCSELFDSLVILEPCKHRIVCEECSSRLKKCFLCHRIIDKRITQDGRVVALKSKQPNQERIRYLESKMVEIEESISCPICMERKRNTVFLCGHVACDKCSQTLQTCHMCRKEITKRINIY
ncbi:E3 ubiquitin-protein ligase MIB2 [Nilaparvata lugens]|uniref:E3 ubiquitin-protein ligase MIB2 n=1 Tax=Nilaparvata lugens TaxID=108931 RepID=UPI00193DAE14|nr:E3 ubiquitin-protein ligase MIB2 [Nilaparvata lugens]